MKKFTLLEWKAEGSKRFGSDSRKWRFKCPKCGNVQTLEEFQADGIEEPENKFYFSCIGRYVSGKGCDWTLGGLFQIHKTEVESSDGKWIPVFEFADDEREDDAA